MEGRKLRRLLGLIAVLAVGAVIVARRSGNAQGATGGVPTGAVVAHLTGRFIGGGGQYQLIGYVVFAEQAGFSDLAFAGEPGERTARFSLRTDPFRLKLIPNGDSFHVTRMASEDGSVPMVRFYFDPSPDRDYSRPDSFSSGFLVGVLRPRATQGVLSPSHWYHLVGTIEVENLFSFPINDQMMSLLGFPGALTLSLEGLPPSQEQILEDADFSVPFSAVAISAGSFQTASANFRPRIN